MPVLHADQTQAEKIKEGLTRRIISNKSLMMVVVDFSGGPWKEADPPHSHPHEQTCYVADGEIMFICEGEADQHLQKGDLFSVPAGSMHTIRLLSSNARLVDSFTPLREDFL